MKTKIIIVAAVLALATAVAAALSSRAGAQGAPALIYVCQGVQDGQDPGCANAQEFEVFDANGAPIYSVGEYGGDAVFGDNRSVFAPGNVTSPSVVESFTDPVSYARTFGHPTSCVTPQVWLEPHGLWHCVLDHWVKALNL